ncbi:Uncharacterized membrane-associated protein-like protein [Desulforamulus reducens MI-1]|uniref:Uncharacterized membrane-associated protein-like protein n=1 Tax=Desulforamulus reducens (strain ATCC BAA-1160 / DSM 100696 / MI-1) TaxID=349161 RepID=A4J6W8_DESRM|nr:DedA family protein [Desulforamulus reducens]ABO50821.1 Uncharacterized membrane-associated protein-like protein [Desulforamulus reducens MI-1]
MTEQILEHLSKLGLPGLFVGVFLEALGLPFPGSVLVGLTGFLCRQGDFNIFIAWLVALAGYMLGSATAFTLGRYIGEPFLIKWGKYLRLTQERFSKAQELFVKSAPAFIIGGRFIPTIGNLTPYVAGISGISIFRFLFFDAIHAVLWLTVFLGGGALLGQNWPKIMDVLGFKYLWAVLIFLLGMYMLRHYLPIFNRNKI